MNTIDFFKKNNYCLVKDSIGKDLLDVITQYALFDEMQNFRSEKSQGRGQVPDAHSVYADPAMESMLLFLLPIMEKNTGLKLFPTYSYYRIYRPGDELVEHKDRESCEISCTLCFNYEYNDPKFSWPIYMDQTAVSQSPGDLVIYRGCDIPHRREKFILNDDEAWHLQGFFHYVDANGPCAEWKYDKRNSIGHLHRSSVPSNEKSYIVRTK